MKIDLSDRDIDEVLSSQCYGHMGCSQKESGKMYIVPITYVYHDGAIYSFSFEGRKIAMLRNNPEACFQVEDLSTEDMWKSVIAWGQYEELEGEDRTKAFSLLLDRLWEHGEIAGQTIRMPFRESREALEAAREDRGVILYRVNITEKSGRLEQYEHEAIAST